jgi:hypothetical protein
MREGSMQNKDSYVIYVRDVMPGRTRDDLENEWRLLTENLRLIINNSKTIIEKKKYFHTPVAVAKINASFLGSRNISLGVLLLLWNDGLLKDKCPLCGNDAFIIKASGSVLIGKNKWYGYCIECNKGVCGKSRNYLCIWRPAFNLERKYSNYAIIKRYNLTSEKWFERLKETRRSDEIYKKKVNSSTLNQLINDLKTLPYSEQI